MSAIHAEVNVISVDVGSLDFRHLKPTDQTVLLLPRIRMKNAASTQFKHSDRRLLWMGLVKLVTSVDLTSSWPCI